MKEHRAETPAKIEASRYRRVPRASADVPTVVDRDTLFVYVALSPARFLGYSQDGLLFRHVHPVHQSTNIWGFGDLVSGEHSSGTVTETVDKCETGHRFHSRTTGLAASGNNSNECSRVATPRIKTGLVSTSESLHRLPRHTNGRYGYLSADAVGLDSRLPLSSSSVDGSCQCDHLRVRTSRASSSGKWRSIE